MRTKINAIAFMEKMIKKHKIDFEQAMKRDASEEIILNIHKKILYYEMALEALQNVGDFNVKP